MKNTRVCTFGMKVGVPLFMVPKRFFLFLMGDQGYYPRIDKSSTLAEHKRNIIFIRVPEERVVRGRRMKRTILAVVVLAMLAPTAVFSSDSGRSSESVKSSRSSASMAREQEAQEKKHDQAHTEEYADQRENTERNARQITSPPQNTGIHVS